MSQEIVPQGQFILYKSEDGGLKLDVRFDGDTVWLSQDQMSVLFDKAKSTINEHIKNIFAEGELEKSLVMTKFGNSEFASKPTNYYNLDVIISVGYRVKSLRGTQFRIWATQHLREFIVKGFVLDDERLKNPDLPFDYFDELLRRIQDIRTSERRFYQKITDIYATSADYDPTAEISIKFFQTVQNKLHWAITGKTAAEIVYNRADSSSPNMGLTSWRGVRVRKQDVTIAKNYLDHEELSALNNLVEQYLVFAEGQAMRRIPMNMQDWVNKLDGFLVLNDRGILQNAGSISHSLAVEKASLEYEEFCTKRQKELDSVESDFDRAVKALPKPKKDPQS